VAEFTEAYDFRGRTLVDRAGETIGVVDEVRGDWALVRSGLFGTRRTLVPLGGAVPRGEAVEVAVDRDTVRDAPDAADLDEAALRRHYGLSGGDDAMTRSEEELHVGTVWRPRERVRLRKVVVTEHVTIPVRREELRVERVPVTAEEEGAASAEPPAPADEVTIVLHEERPVIEMRVVARERVRLRVETVADSHEIREELRSERIGLDPHADRREGR
jgi:uncharacterized protein (TIGR02271 family)